MSETDHMEYFTLVFRGDLRMFEGNPLTTKTPFGEPVIASLGNVCAEADDLRAELEAKERERLEEWTTE
jgi:hypothetical protein